VQGDAFSWLRSRAERFDVVLLDFPDPDDAGTAKLYSAARGCPSSPRRSIGPGSSSTSDGDGATTEGYDRSVSSSSTTRTAAGIVLGSVLIAGVLVSATDLRVEYLGPVMVYGVALATVVALLLAPAGKAR